MLMEPLIISNVTFMAIEPQREPHLLILSLGSDTKNIGFLANRHLDFYAENILEHVLKRYTSKEMRRQDLTDGKLT